MKVSASAFWLSAAIFVTMGGAEVTAATKKVAPVTSATAAGWTVDKAKSKIRFRSSFGGDGFEGGFSKWDAQINFDPKNLAASKVVVQIDLTSAGTGDTDRDSSLPSENWLNTAKFPRATFTTSAIKDLGGGKYQALGALTLRGVTKPVTLPFTLAITGDTAQMTGQAVLNRGQFGVGQGQFASGDTVPLNITVPVTVVATRAP